MAGVAAAGRRQRQRRQPGVLAMAGGLVAGTWCVSAGWLTRRESRAAPSGEPSCWRQLLCVTETREVTGTRFGKRAIEIAGCEAGLLRPGDGAGRCAGRRSADLPCPAGCLGAKCLAGAVRASGISLDGCMEAGPFGCLPICVGSFAANGLRHDRTESELASMARLPTSAASVARRVGSAGETA